MVALARSPARCEHSRSGWHPAREPPIAPADTTDGHGSSVTGRDPGGGSAHFRPPAASPASNAGTFAYG